MAVYEQPLNEKIRLFLRLEFLIKRFKIHLDDPTPENCQAAIMLLLELYNLPLRCKKCIAQYARLAKSGGEASF